MSGRVVSFLAEFRKGTVALVWVAALIAVAVTMLAGSLALSLWLLNLAAGPACKPVPAPVEVVSSPSAEVG